MGRWASLSGVCGMDVDLVGGGRIHLVGCREGRDEVHLASYSRGGGGSGYCGEEMSGGVVGRLGSLKGLGGVGGMGVSLYGVVCGSG
ncbi:hypothetical protein E2C01_030305 [Portunus trituberculatus]|uniref:Uncharacterized protein n=1 Tax=Portunus trituberculatus TaxID=210409 RepID=A0A5B7EUI3_PORTR|nr:hypothetical protein [Portunus trituberculatus]